MKYYEGDSDGGDHCALAQQAEKERAKQQKAAEKARADIEAARLAALGMLQIDDRTYHC